MVMVTPHLHTVCIFYRVTLAVTCTQSKNKLIGGPSFYSQLLKLKLLVAMDEYKYLEKRKKKEVRELD